MSYAAEREIVENQNDVYSSWNILAVTVKPR